MKLNIIGDIYGNLTVISLNHKKEYKKYFKCNCNCGNKVIVYMGHLRNGHTTSCGCKIINNPPAKTHGMAGTPIYKVYYEMLNRCHNPLASNYYKYGKKGITVCDTWKNSFEQFNKWAIEYKPGLSIDRIDNKKNYTPDNCRWTTMSIQNTNKGKCIRNTSGYKYINWDKTSEKWYIRITVNKKRIDLGKFLCIEKAKTHLIKYLTDNNLKEHLKAFNYD